MNENKIYPSGELISIDDNAYRIGGLINKGTDGRIYVAYSSNGADPVFAVKYIECTLGDELYKSVLREIEAAQMLKNCPYTVDLLGDLVRRDSQNNAEVFLLMENMKCCRDMILSEREILKMGAQICRALEYIDKRGLIHGDVKPANIFLNKSGDWQLGDFGCTQRRGRIIREGSAAYRAPETIQGRRCDVRADVYALGITLYKLKSGYLPFCGESSSEAEIAESIDRRMSGEEVPRLEGMNEIILNMCSFRARERKKPKFIANELEKKEKRKRKARRQIKK